MKRKIKASAGEGFVQRKCVVGSHNDIGELSLSVWEKIAACILVKVFVVEIYFDDELFQCNRQVPSAWEEIPLWFCPDSELRRC